MDLEQLAKLHALKQQSILTDAEFELQKQKILNSTKYNSSSSSNSCVTTDGTTIHDPSKNLVWLIALTPLIGSFLEEFFMESSDFLSSGDVCIILILNIVLCYFDKEKLKKHNFDTKELDVWLIPLYLWERAKLFKHSPAYCYVWIITFINLRIWFWVSWWFESWWLDI